MFLHIGQERMIDEKDIVIILDYQKAKKSSVNKALFRAKSDEGALHDQKNKEQNKSVIITKDMIYYSSIAPATLLRRVLE